MRVEELIINDKKKYLLISDDGIPVLPVAKFLKYLDLIEKSENTIKTYAYHLKLFFQFLKQSEKEFTEIDIDLLATFVGWLRNPNQNTKVLSFGETKSKRSESTVNAILSATLSFYDYLGRSELFEDKINPKIKRQLNFGSPKFKSFLSHLGDKKKISKNILKIKEPKREIRTLKKHQIEAIRDACSNQRDELLIRIMYEGGLRVGEAMSLWIEDFNVSDNSIKVRKSKTTYGQGRIVYVSNETMNLFQDYLIDTHCYDSNFVFVNLRGESEGEPIQKWTANDIVKRIKKKTGIDFTAHMLRHTFATELHENGTDIAIIQRLLGHSQVQTTINTYLHPSDQMIRDEYDKVFKNKLGVEKNEDKQTD